MLNDHTLPGLRLCTSAFHLKSMSKLSCYLPKTFSSARVLPACTLLLDFNIVLVLYPSLQLLGPNTWILHNPVQNLLTNTCVSSILYFLASPPTRASMLVGVLFHLQNKGISGCNNKGTEVFTLSKIN
uniref:Uncharacterized protein n=1 Tax=Arundo donax TaxID=35708 RepID=A0A0A9H6S1_ARUDO